MVQEDYPLIETKNMKIYIALLHAELLFLCEKGSLKIPSQRVHEINSSEVSYEDFSSIMCKAPQTQKPGDSLGYQLVAVEPIEEPLGNGQFMVSMSNVVSFSMLLNSDSDFLRECFDGFPYIPTFSSLNFDAYWIRWTQNQRELSRTRASRILLEALDCEKYFHPLSTLYSANGDPNEVVSDCLIHRFLAATKEMHNDDFLRKYEDTYAYPFASIRQWVLRQRDVVTDFENSLIQALDQAVEKTCKVEFSQAGVLSVELSNDLLGLAQSHGSAFNEYLHPISVGMICTYFLRIDYGPHPSPLQIVSDLQFVREICGEKALAAAAFLLSRRLDETFVCRVSAIYKPSEHGAFDIHLMRQACGLN
jgi:hypothetical protein